MNQTKISLPTLLLFLIFNSCISIDTLIPRNAIKDGTDDMLVSSKQGFALGFFSTAGNPTRRYVGIWYNEVPEKTIVWVANRDNPINGTSGVLAINSQGNLVLYGHNQTVPVWSANVSLSSTNKSNNMVQLLDTGNLVLIHQSSNAILWQSFDYPTDTMLPYMKLGLDRRTGKNWFLSSWKSEDDPGTGNIFYRIDPSGYPQLFLYKGSVPWWRSGPWTGERWSGVPEMTRNFMFHASFVNNNDEVFITDGLITKKTVFTRMMVNESGVVQRLTWNDGQWIGYWSAPKERCDSYGECGANGYCDPYDSDIFRCKCLPGFEPKSPSAWDIRDGSDGCIRKANISMCRNGEGFVQVVRAKVPDTTMARTNMSLSLKACEEECLKNCNCTAYTSAYESGIGCLTWYGDLLDTRIFSNVGQDIYIRVDAVELAKHRKSKSPLAKAGVQAILIVSVAVASLIAVIVAYCLVKKRRKARDRRRSKSFFSFSTQIPSYFGDSQSGKGNDEGRLPDIPFFDLGSIAAATNNFSDANKLGEGGFGSVYKGLLHDGKEIAVKRLSRYSGQGAAEFKNEVALIARLQHRNLVRMIGYCIQDQEKMLIYEYLPNKSLDTFIFSDAKRSVLDWSMRHNIICGIVRGILYLHQDSRLKIIHRDLKASNVLLDTSMNSKISDFGMARIFGVDQIEANTNRVVGTYGYMSPEYAMQGLFSVKSDVYSFGVLLLEIITGRKNSSYYEESTSSNLVGHVWDLWREGRALQIVDVSLGCSYPEQEVLRCIQIGLLCVQESAADRPTMSAVVFMLSNHETVLASPKQPAFIMKRSYNSGDPISTTEERNSVNDVTVTILEAR